MQYSSSVSITLLPYAVAAARTEGKLFINSVNRGENSLSGEGESIVVSGRPLGELLLEQDFPRVDAMKIDIEGHEYPALESFYRDADPRIWPHVLILEAVHIDPEQSPIELCLRHGYRLIEETKMNVVLERSA